MIPQKAYMVEISEVLPVEISDGNISNISTIFYKTLISDF